MSQSAGSWMQDAPISRKRRKKACRGDRSILVFQIARCVASSVMRKTSDKGGDNRRSVPLGTAVYSICTKRRGGGMKQQI